MNFTEINHALTQAINNLAEGEIDVAALAMAEDLEREELEEAKARSKRKQRAIDKASYAKHGVKWRSTASGHRVAINKRGKVVGGNPFVLANLPKSALAKSAKKKAAKASKTKQINKMLGGKGKKKGSSAKDLRAQLAKAKKKMGKDFNAMLMQDMDLMGTLMESVMPAKGKAMEFRNEKFIVSKVFPSKDHADGPLGSTLLRLIKKGGGAAILKKTPDKEPYLLILKANGQPDGFPIWMKPAQYKRAMSYE